MRSSFSKRLVFLVILLLANRANAASDPKAILCIKKLIKNTESLQSYSAILNKNEYQQGRAAIHQKLRIEQSSSGVTHIVYEDEGLTGIKNNGMSVDYGGGTEIKFSLGRSRGLGFLVQGPARLLAGKSMELTSKNALQDELFTLNRAGYFPLAKTLSTQLPGLEKAVTGGVTIIGSGCNLKYVAHTNKMDEIELSPSDSLQAIEDSYGTLAFFILHYNHEHFSDLYSIFHRQYVEKIKIPRWFFNFEMNLDESTGLLKSLKFFLDERLLAEYQYQLVSVLK